MNGEEWDVADNVDQNVTIGTNKFGVSHFKGCRQHWGCGQAQYEEYWDVYLPHQCEEFDIVSSASHEAAVRQMETFIAEAQLALEALKGML